MVVKVANTQSHLLLVFASENNIPSQPKVVPTNYLREREFMVINNLREEMRKSVRVK